MSPCRAQTRGTVDACPFCLVCKPELREVLTFLDWYVVSPRRFLGEQCNMVNNEKVTSFGTIDAGLKMRCFPIMMFFLSTSFLMTFFLPVWT